MCTFANSEDPDEKHHNAEFHQGTMLHFIRVYTVCKGKKRSSDKRIQYFLKIIT